ncbi:MULTISPECIES: 2,3-dihydro-2,3-dihydroxybenzoate dehydrogenase [unclassified Motilimonas]|uniref:2,3-dihydro-2,3-dihydroxybenzoate dehydrogenase n=1 Tax=unclassified Motilimonas TaxID=2643697 RepID=UPI001E5AFA9E|nr:MULTISPECIES: 2,3-dihydro-2,3-dihydroxybenzoate dehydrogenase [unclassified Motilimonas]MCE0556847.1 2,3-dihydro-2,3-dihydroxybenzoate dehydrogenase [Motilimonas sp. E26]MDO6525103.1 2,3-dihydro-2,3-dihydroxybenzoate dehydrogenase [Motilimonas sp. 1_MG-2023]
MEKFLKQQHVLLTGAAKGIGFSTLEHLLQSGAKVLATDIDEQLLASHSAVLAAQYPGQLRVAKLDLSQPEQVKQRIAQWVTELGEFDHLVSCAGILHLGSLCDMPSEQIEQTFMVNSFGVLAAMQGVAKCMKLRRKGNIVVVGSNAANTPRANMGAYAASKSALHMLVKSMGIELAPLGIRCNLVSPGSTRTEMQLKLWHENYGEEQVIAGDAKQFRLGIPLNKIAEPADIAQSILFLMSDAANHITLHDLRIDGGATLDH